MIGRNRFHKLAASLRAGFIVMLSCGSLSSGFAAGPEKISDSAARQIGALEQEKASRSALHLSLIHI